MILWVESLIKNNKMKKLISIIIIAMSFTVTAQDTTATVYDQIKEAAKTFEEAVAPYVQKLMQGVETGVDFAVRETPIVIQQFLVYKAIFYWTWVLISLTMIIGSWRIRARIIETAKALFERTAIGEELTELEQGNLRWRRDMKLSDSKEIGTTLFAVVSLVATLIFFINIFSAIRVTFFPKLYLVQEFINLF